MSKSALQQGRISRTWPRLSRWAGIAVAGGLAAIAAAQPGQAAVFPSFPAFISTGQQSFTIDPSTIAHFTTDQTLLGNQTIDEQITAPGVTAGAVQAMLAFQGAPFKAVYSVEGGGNHLVFSDMITVRATASLNGMALGSPEIFNIALSDSCGDPTMPTAELVCSTKQLLTAFDVSQPIDIPAGTPFSDVSFSYSVLQSNEYCQAQTYSGGVLQFTSACLSGGMGIVDTNNLADPSWSGSLTLVPEPGSVGLLMAGLSGLLGIAALRRAKGI